MQNQGILPKAFLTFDDAVKLIQSETRENPRVDISRLVRNFKWLEAKHNFTIFFIKRDESGKIVSNGNRPVQIANEYEKTTLEHVIREKYKELAHMEVPDLGIRKITTVVTDADNGGNMQGIPMNNPDSTIKVGDSIDNVQG